MLARIQIRRDSGANWTSADPVLLSGELGINTDDSTFKIGDGVNPWSGLTYSGGGGGGGSGDVVGPASATDNAIARFNATTGKLIQNSVVTIADASGNMAGVGTINTHTIPGGTGTFALTSQITGTNSGTNTGDQSLFQTIAVSGQSNVVADSATDTLTLVAGTNITITTDASTDTITINASGGGGGSGDVVGPASATDNAVCRFDSTTGELIQNSVVIIADTTGNMSGVGTLNTHTIPGGTGTIALTSNITGTNSGTNTGDVTLSAIGATANANGATITGQDLNLQPASISFGGVVTTGTQTFNGSKTFNSDVTLSGNVLLTTSTNASLTGSNQRIPTHTDACIRFTNASLTSLGSANISAVIDGHVLMITNDTGGTITIVDNYGGAAAGEAFRTGVTSDLKIPNQSTQLLRYDSTSARWLCVSTGLTDLATTAVTGILPNANTTAVATNTNSAIVTRDGSGNFAAGTITASLSGNASTVTTNANLTGDVTSVGNATTIANDAVTYGKMQNVSATSRLLGRKTAAAGDTEECTLSEALDFVGSPAQGDILYRNATVWTKLGAGTNGHFLKTQGAGSDPQWAAASGSGAVATDGIWDVKGDLAVGTGADTASKLTVGANGTVLSADSAEATGLKWVTVSGTGDVVGPASATDNAVVRFDSTTGKLIQNSVVTIADSTGNIAGAGTLNTHTIPGGTGTIALTSDITGTNSGTNTGDQTITLTGGVTGSGTGSFAATVVTNANLTGPITSVGNATTIADAELSALAGLTSAADKGIQFTGSGTAATYDLTAAGKALLDDASAAEQVTTLGLDNAKIASIGITIDGGGSAITTGLKGYIEVPYACTITRATMLADTSGSAVVDIWKDTYANYPPLVGDTITAAAKPTITAAVKSQDATLTGWTTSVAAGDILAFNVDSASSITRLHLNLRVTKT